VTYKIDIDPEARGHVLAMPRELLTAFGEVMATLELAPWNGVPFAEGNPEGSVRQVVFGRGRAVVVYMILEYQLRVDVLKVMWVS
jgi:hypothetical protein